MKTHCEHFISIVAISLTNNCNCDNHFQTLMEGKGDKATAEGMELLRKEVEKMKEALKTSEDGKYPCTCANILLHVK